MRGTSFEFLFALIHEQDDSVEVASFGLIPRNAWFPTALKRYTLDWAAPSSSISKFHRGSILFFSFAEEAESTMRSRYND